MMSEYGNMYMVYFDRQEYKNIDSVLYKTWQIDKHNKFKIEFLCGPETVMHKYHDFIQSFKVCCQ